MPTTPVWKTSRRELGLTRPLVMAILNVTPDSFSDGGKFTNPDAAVAQAEKMISEGADILDIGGESTRPGSSRVPAEEETSRVIPVIEAVVKRFDVPVSIDTSKSEVARAALAAGAEIINDISGLRFDAQIAPVAAEKKAALVLMHSRGDFETMHSQPPVDDIMTEVAADFRRSTAAALARGIASAANLLDLDRVVIGGGVAQSGELLFAPLRAELKRRATLSFSRDLEVRQASLGTEAGVVGAAGLVFQRHAPD